MREQVVKRRRYVTPDGTEIRIDTLECGHSLDVTARKDHQMFRLCRLCPSGRSTQELRRPGIAE